MTVTLIMGQPAAEGMSLWTARQFYNLQLHPKGDEAERLIPHQNPEAMRRNCPMLVFQENKEAAGNGLVAAHHRPPTLSLDGELGILTRLQ